LLNRRPHCNFVVHVRFSNIKQGNSCPHGILRRTTDGVKKREDRSKSDEKTNVSFFVSDEKD